MFEHIPVSATERHRASLGTTAVDTLVRDQFSDPDLWPKRSYSVPLAAIAGLSRQSLEGAEGGRPIDLNRAWLVAPYGVRPIVDESQPGVVRMEVCDNETLPLLGLAIAEKILTDEKSRPPRPLSLSDTRGGIDNPANNNAWLEAIRDGYWPIMNYQMSHDRSSEHLGNMIYMPAELQWLITDVATCALEQRLTPDSRMDGKLQLLPGEKKEEQAPFQFGHRRDDGINVLDRFSDTASYLTILADLVTYNGTIADRMEQIRGSQADRGDEALYEAQRELKVLRDHLGLAANFVTRHRKNRNILAEEVDAWMSITLEGTTRIASKIRGEYPSSSPLGQLRDLGHLLLEHP